MIIICGLGNPGKEFEQTRHNAGFMFLDFLRSNILNDNDKWLYEKKFDAEVFKASFGSLEFVLLRPQTFMNKSGNSLRKYIDWIKTEKVEKLFLAYDDLDLNLGSFKVGESRPKVHNGVNSVVQSVKDVEIINIRIGIENRNADDRIQGGDYVLQKFSKKELELLNNTFETCVSELIRDYILT